MKEFIIYIVLLILSAMIFLLPHSALPVAVAAGSLTFVKSVLITDNYMHLRTAHPLWRFGMILYMGLVTGILAYLLQ
jgi:hypothetical protein